MVNVAEAVRIYFRHHPRASFVEVALAIGEPREKVKGLCAKMAKRGILGRVPQMSPASYFVIREPRMTEQRRDFLVHKDKRERRGETRVSTVAEFLAAGGEIEVLPGFNPAPPKCRAAIARMF